MSSRFWTHCVKITRQDGVVIGMTELDKDVVFGGVTYKAANAYTGTNVDKTSSLSVNNGNLQGLLIEDISAADLRDGFFDFATMEGFIYDFDAGTKVKDLGKGYLGNVTLTDTGYTAEYRSLEQVMQQPIGRKVLPTCDAKLGDDRCGVNLASFTVTGSVTTATNQTTFTDSSRTEADGYFNFGLLTFTSGLNAGLSREVKTFASDVFTLLLAFPYEIAVTDEYEVYAGCDKRKTTCINKFNNVINFRGIDTVPGQDYLNVTGGMNRA